MDTFEYQKGSYVEYRKTMPKKENAESHTN